MDKSSTMRQHKAKLLVFGLFLVLVATLVIGGILSPNRGLVPAGGLARLGEVVTLTIGTIYAAESADYTTDGTDDDVQFQAAIEALPSSGGKIRILGGTYNFSVQVTRAIDNILIEGIGKATLINLNAVTPVFSVGTQSGWTFKDFSTDAGGLDVSTATNWSLLNVHVGASFFTVDSGTTGLVRLPNLGLYLRDTDASHSLIVKPGSNLTADRIFTLTTGDAPRTITLSGDTTLDDWFDQSVKIAANPTFGNLTITSFAAGWTNAGNTIADLGSITTGDINGGTIDGVTIGGTSAGAGTFAAITGTGFTVTSEVIQTAGNWTFQKAYIIGTTVGTLTLNPAGELVLDLGTKEITGLAEPIVRSFQEWDWHDYNDPGAFLSAEAVSGSGTAVVDPRILDISTGVTVSSTALRRMGTAWAGWQRGNQQYIDWSKRIVFSSKITSLGTGSASGVSRFILGKLYNSGVGAPTSKAIGFRIDNLALKGIVHNGSSLAVVDLSTSMATHISHDVQAVSDGAGNVEFFVDGVSAGSSTAGPTGLSTVNLVAVHAEVDNGGDTYSQRLIIHSLAIGMEQ